MFDIWLIMSEVATLVLDVKVMHLLKIMCWLFAVFGCNVVSGVIKSDEQ
jgi:hypothetical protein